MNVVEAIKERRAFRSLEPTEITPGILNALAESARLAPSCFNKQPTRFVFVHSPEALEKMHSALSPGNEWVRTASLIIAVLGRKEDDCVMRDGREYYLFDVGLAVAFLVLRATELGLVAHPIAGYDQKKAKEILGVPEEYAVVTLVNVGKHSDKINSLLTPKQVEAETQGRLERLPLSEFAFENNFGNPLR